MGAAVKQSYSSLGLKRSDVFLTTKILSPGGSAQATYEKVLESVGRIDPDADDRVGYVDLFLIHSASGGSAARKEMWRALERLYKEGRAKAIGVSNFGVGHIEEMRRWKEDEKEEEGVRVWPPHVNQIELHPWTQQRTIVDYCKKHNIVVEAYSPLVRNYKAADPTLVRIAESYGVSTAQILIRYSLQKGWVPLPKSDTPSRIESNADVFGFEIKEEDMATLDALDQGAAGAIVQAVDNN